MRVFHTGIYGSQLYGSQYASTAKLSSPALSPDRQLRTDDKINLLAPPCAESKRFALNSVVSLSLALARRFETLLKTLA